MCPILHKRQPCWKWPPFYAPLNLVHVGPKRTLIPASMLYNAWLVCILLSRILTICKANWSLWRFGALGGNCTNFRQIISIIFFKLQSCTCVCKPMPLKATQLPVPKSQLIRIFPFQVSAQLRLHVRVRMADIMLEVRKESSQLLCYLHPSVSSVIKLIVLVKRHLNYLEIDQPDIWLSECAMSIDFWLHWKGNFKATKEKITRSPNSVL